MANQVFDDRDQNFVLYEMLNVEELCQNEKYRDFSREVFDMTLDVARKLALEEVYPANAEADREGCRLENGEVHVPRCYHRLMKLFREGGWASIAASAEAGGQGFPYTLYLAASEGFIHNFAFICYPFLAVGAGHLIEQYGTDEQKKKYMEKMYSGFWGGSMALTEPEAGSDVGSLKTKAVRQPDGSYRISGTKIFITAADSDLFENIVNPVLARIEGDPAGTKGISIFLVPKYLVNPDGSLGRRNDYTIGGIEHKMGIKGSATCLVNFGDNGNCYAELLGEERQGMKVMFQLMNEARIGVGLQGMGTAATAYLHALQYARDRVQGADIANFQNPDAPRVPIVNHADVRRMLLWMKSHVEGMRALVYYSGLCFDRAEALENREEAEKWHGIMDILTPICKSYCSDIGFRVAEQAIQVYGGYGYCQDYPVEQYLRDLKIASIYEGTNGIQSLDLVGRKLGQKKGANFIRLLGEMNSTIQAYNGIDELKDLAADLQTAVNLLGEMGMFFAQCGKAGKYFIPITNAYPFLNMMGNIVLGWLLFWQAGIAAPKLNAILKQGAVNPDDRAKRDVFIKENRDAAFYNGKILSARYYIKHVLPQAEAIAKSIKTEDITPVEITPECFAV